MGGIDPHNKKTRRHGWWPLLLCALTGCWAIQDEQERRDCDRALEVVCACASIDCLIAEPGGIVDVLQRCDGDEIFRDRGYHLSVCIQDAQATYCTILDSLADDDPFLCNQTCDLATACDLESACLAYQDQNCDPP